MADQARSRARRNDPCPSCGHRKYRIDNGLLFCRNCGTQAEGYVQYDMGDDADAGMMGSVSKQRKEKHEKEKRHLTGLKGKSLYLEALQLVLRHQLQWLVKEKGHLPELETVVRDLWAARVAGFPEDAEDEFGDQGSQVFSSSGFSSGGEEEEEEEQTKRAPHAKSWDPESSSQWPAPSMVDTLALCYLGSLLLRLPTTISDFHHWANTGNIPYRAIYHNIPQEMKDRMPAEFTKQLKRPTRERVADTSIHHAVFDLACSFHLNYSMIFPAPNASTSLVHFVKTLALPIETAIIAIDLSRVLGLNDQFPISQSRVHIVDHPEIQTMALLVVAAKLCFPLEGPSAALSWIHSIPRLDWHAWKTAYDEQSLARSPPAYEKYERVTATDVAAMTGQELDSYLTYLTGRHDHANDSAVTAFFPKPAVPELALPEPELSAEERSERAKSIICKATAGLPGVTNPDIPGAVSPACRYVQFVTEESLSGPARRLYEAAAEASGTSFAEMIRAIRMLENKMVRWGTEQRRPERDDALRDEGATVVAG